MSKIFVVLSLLAFVLAIFGVAIVHESGTGGMIALGLALYVVSKLVP